MPKTKKHSGLSSGLHQPPPIYRINLSLPPAERYVELARLYRNEMRSLRTVFDDLILSLSHNIPLGLVHWLARVFLRGLSTKEETEELRGISGATDIDLYLLVCFNTVLDLLMGCTSGGVVTNHGSETKMLHFRTLDWGMEELRSLIVQLEFVRDEDPEEVLATTITYVGFIGVLTGVKKDLSVSLNFRPVHDLSKNFAFYLNHLLVLTGNRPSITSILRKCLLPSPPPPKSSSRGSELALATFSDIIVNFPSLPTTAAYLIFSDGKKTITMEKDVHNAIVHSDPCFIVITNNDQDCDSILLQDAARDTKSRHSRLELLSEEPLTLEELIEDSIMRRACMQAKWDRRVEKGQRALARRRQLEEATHKENPTDDHRTQSETQPSLRLRQKAAEGQKRARSDENGISGDINPSNMAISPQEALRWLTTYPVVNEDTHYATLMDPTEGNFFWISQYKSGQI